ncbi:hypothetical protein ACT9XH_09365 [Methanococcoides methylutens]
MFSKSEYVLDYLNQRCPEIEFNSLMKGKVEYRKKIIDMSCPE